GRAVGVDVGDVGGGEPRHLQRRLHAGDGAPPAGGGGGDVVRVGGGRPAEHLGQDRGAAGLGHLPRLEDQHGGALRDHEAVAGGGEGLGHVAARERGHVRE